MYYVRASYGLTKTSSSDLADSIWLYGGHDFEHFPCKNWVTGCHQFT